MTRSARTTSHAKPVAGAPFSVAESLRRARQVLAEPPAESWISRPEPHGELVQEFALPLELCPTTNATRGAPGWRLGKLKEALYRIMWAQAGGGYSRGPLPGRPQVLCVRFTNRIVDACSDWAKFPVDMLCVRTLRARKRLGFLEDDSPRHIELYQWSEPVPRGEGFAYLQVRTGGDE